MGISGLVKIGFVVALVLIGMRVFKARKESTAIDENRESTSFAPAKKRASIESFETSANTDPGQMHIRCTQCALVMSQGDKFCGGCGTLAPEVVEKKVQRSAIYCGSCGSELLKDDLFCGNCGKKI